MTAYNRRLLCNSGRWHAASTFYAFVGVQLATTSTIKLHFNKSKMKDFTTDGVGVLPTHIASQNTQPRRAYCQ